MEVFTCRRNCLGPGVIQLQVSHLQRVAHIAVDGNNWMGCATRPPRLVCANLSDITRALLGAIESEGRLRAELPDHVRLAVFDDGSDFFFPSGF